MKATVKTWRGNRDQHLLLSSVRALPSASWINPIGIDTGVFLEIGRRGGGV